jgi:hypothetical protein
MFGLIETARLQARRTNERARARGASAGRRRAPGRQTRYCGLFLGKPNIMCNTIELGLN